MFLVPEYLRHDAKWRGDTIIRTYLSNGEDLVQEAVDFYCHSGVICPVSSFFDVALSGSWKETQDPDVQPTTARAIMDGSTTSALSESIKEMTIHPRNTSLLGIIEMPEESPEVIRDFLCLVYPHSEVQITLDSFQKLCAFADKIDSDVVRAACKKFAESRQISDPFLVINWAWDNAEHLLVQAASKTLLADLEKYKAMESYTALPLELRYLLEQTWSRWLLRYSKIDDQLRDEKSYTGPYVWPKADCWETNSYNPVLAKVKGALDKLHAHPSPSTLEKLLYWVQGSMCGSLEKGIQDLRTPELRVEDIEAAAARASESRELPCAMSYEHKIVSSKSV